MLARSHIRNDERLSGLVTDTHVIHNIGGHGWRNTLMTGVDYSLKSCATGWLMRSVLPPRWICDPRNTAI